MNGTGMRTVFIALATIWILPVFAAVFADPGEKKLEDSGGILRTVKRDVLISNRGKYKVPDEQLHFPWLFESPNGNWYLTYREGPHNEAQWRSAGNRVQCVQSRDQGKTWIPWMGMRAQPWMYQFFVTRLKNGTLTSS